jgi:ABC-type antimicrobial peptide transport system permease subunit
VLDEFLTLFPATLELSICAIALAVIVGIPAGIFAAVRRGSLIDQTIMGTALIGYSMPIFWWGLLLIVLFSGVLQWTPVSGRISLLYYFPSVTGFMLIDSLLSGGAGQLYLFRTRNGFGRTDVARQSSLQLRLAVAQPVGIHRRNRPPFRGAGGTG